jgi:hypothetical protein
VPSLRGGAGGADEAIGSRETPIVVHADSGCRPLVSVITGLAFGAYPALRAARLFPIDSK